MIRQYTQSIILFFLMGSVLFTSCEDEITIPSQFEASQLVVDAWLTNTNKTQVIAITRSIDYFAGGAPPVVRNAQVSLCSDDTQVCYDFIYNEADDNYMWTPQGDEVFGAVGEQFTLTIAVDEQIYTSTEQIYRTAVADSIGITFEEESLVFEEGLYAQLYARDQPGRGDTYWIRTFKNDTLLNRPEEILIAYDATFDAGANIDGIYFLTGIRLGINEIRDDGTFEPYQPGDHIRVEVHSISNTAFEFLNIASEQILNEGIFTVPVANSEGNIINAQTGEAILGIFNIAEVAAVERTVE